MSINFPSEKSDAFFKEVAAFTTESQWQVPASGEIWLVSKFVGSAAYVSDVVVQLVWDFDGPGETIVYATHGDASFDAGSSFVGDGTKKLAIRLMNDSPEAQSIGGEYTAGAI